MAPSPKSRRSSPKPSSAAAAAAQPFSFGERGDGSVAIAYRGKVVTTLRGASAARFLDRARAAEPDAAQQLMARATGNFKRGNERR